jgi:hypothetical protein
LPTLKYSFEIYVFTILFLHIFILLLLIFFIQILGLTNPTPLTEILSSRFVRKGCNHVISKHMHKQNLSMMHNLLATHGVN